jgi:hypothetical protein
VNLFSICVTDAHRFDARLKIVEIDPLGAPTEYEINRVRRLVVLGCPPGRSRADRPLTYIKPYYHA